jgi:hypothetical protein
MASDANTDNIHPSHVTMEELEKISTMNADALSSSDKAVLLEICEKIEKCGTCRKRYRYFLDSEAVLSALRAASPDATEYIADILREKIDGIGTALDAADTALREKISQWLAGAQNIFRSPFAERARLQPAVPIGTRGEPKLLSGLVYDDTRGEPKGSGQSKNIITVSADEDGFFDFELSEGATLNFEIKKEIECAKPICAVVFGRNDTVFSETYSLVQPHPNVQFLISEKLIELPAGEYTLCVPTLDA